MSELSFEKNDSTLSILIKSIKRSSFDGENLLSFEKMIFTVPILYN